MSNEPRTIWRNVLSPSKGNTNRQAGHAGNAPVFQVIQQADGRLNTRRLSAASPLQTVVRPRRRALSKRAAFLLFVALLVVLAYMAGAASNVHGQEIAEPWCVVSAPVAPALDCVQPRLWLPMVNAD